MPCIRLLGVEELSNNEQGADFTLPLLVIREDVCRLATGMSYLEETYCATGR
jgi:hypothetical protein